MRQSKNSRFVRLGNNVSLVMENQTKNEYHSAGDDTPILGSVGKPIAGFSGSVGFGDIVSSHIVFTMQPCSESWCKSNRCHPLWEKELLMVLILFQKGATSYGFQIDRIWFYINYPKYWKSSGFFGGYGVSK